MSTTEFVIATGNPHKLLEIERILSPLGIRAVSQKEAGVSVDPEETGTTFEENALIKAREVSRAAGLPAVADDSGLCVDALNGRPGVYSARYAGEGASDADRIDKLLGEMKDIDEGHRGASFVSAVCCYFSENDWFCVRGECRGSIAFCPAGSDGFGYDPVFIPDKAGKTYAELTGEEKDMCSHRGAALKKLRLELDKRYANER